MLTTTQLTAQVWQLKRPLGGQNLNMSIRPRLVAFDMDHTLVDVTEAHLTGFRKALATVYGVEVDLALKKHSGNTQLNAIRVICEEAGLDPELIESRLSEAVEVLSQTTISQLDDDLRSETLPGAVDLLDSLRDRGHPLGLITGTVRPVAEVILQRAGLRDYFVVTACGDEASDRPSLLELLLKRFARRSRLDSREPPLVIGDSVRDIRAARQVGLKAIGVASGQFSVQELSAETPQAVLKSLENRQAALDAILAS